MTQPKASGVRLGGNKMLPPELSGNIATKLEPMYAMKARQRQEELGKTHGEDPLGSFEHKGKARDQAAQVKTLEPPDPIKTQFDTIFGFIFDHGTVQDRYIAQELKIEFPELRKLLAVLVKDELIELLPEDKYKVKEVGSL